jgi:O-antigen/teichoic acid export membrane protein
MALRLATKLVAGQDIGEELAIQLQENADLLTVTIEKPRGNIAVAAHLLTGQATVALFALSINLFAARTMGPDGRGELAFFLQVSYVLAAVGAGGQDKAYPASITSTPTIWRSLNDISRLLWLPICITSVAAFVIGAFVTQHGADARYLMASALALLVVGNISSTGLRAASSAASSGKMFLCVNVVAQGTLAFTAIALTLTGKDSPSIWLAAYAVCIAAPPLAAALIARHRQIPITGERIGQLRTARRLGFKILPSAVATIICLRSDRLILPWLAGYKELGLYIVVATLCELIVWPVQAWIDANIPSWHRMHIAGELRRGKMLLVAALYALFASGVMIIACRVLIIPVFGAEFRGSLTLVAPLALGSSLYAISRVAVGLSLAAGRAKIGIAADLSAMIGGLVAYLTLIPHFGALGAAFGSLGAYGISALVATTYGTQRFSIKSGISSRPSGWRPQDPRP